MSLNLNKVTLAGRMTADPELKQTQSGVPVVSFRIAINRRFQSKNADGQGQPQADFLDIVAWRQQAEFVSRYFRKGSSICVIGSIQTRKWTDPQGQQRNTVEVVAEEATFVTPANQNSTAPAANSNAGYTPEAYSTPSFSSASSANFEEIPNDEALPF